MYPERRESGLYKLSEAKTNDMSLPIKHEGIYFFGGRTEKGKCQNTIRILKIGNQ